MLKRWKRKTQKITKSGNSSYNKTVDTFVINATTSTFALISVTVISFIIIAKSFAKAWGLTVSIKVIYEVDFQRLITHKRFQVEARQNIKIWCLLMIYVVSSLKTVWLTKMVIECLFEKFAQDTDEKGKGSFSEKKLWI